MDVEGKGKLEVKDLRTYMDFVKDPYNIIRTFAQRYCLCAPRRVPRSLSSASRALALLSAR